MILHLVQTKDGLLIEQSIETKKLYGLWICMLAGSYAIYDFYLQVAPGVITHELMDAFHINASDIGAMGAVFYYAYAGSQMPSGWLIDRFGARVVLSGYCFITAIATFIFANTMQFDTALIARALTGVGVSIGFLSSYYLAGRWLPHRYFSLAAALLHLAGSLGAMMAQTPLAILSHQVGWRAALNDSALVGVILSLLFIFFIANGPSPRQSTQQATPQSLLQTIFYCLSIKQLRWIAGIGFLGWLPLSIIGSLWGVPYLMNVYAWDKVTASNACSLFWLGSAVGAILLSWLSERLAKRKPPLILCFIGEIIGSCILILGSAMPEILVNIALFTLGICVCLQTLSFSLIKENVPLQFFACASGMINVGAMTSCALSQHFFGWLLTIQQPDSTNYTAHHYQFALGIIPIAAIIGLFITLFKIDETYCQVKELP